MGCHEAMTKFYPVGDISRANRALLFGGGRRTLVNFPFLPPLGP